MSSVRKMDYVHNGYETYFVNRNVLLFLKILKILELDVINE